MPMGLTKYLVRAELTNRNMLFWGVGYMLLWIIMGAFLFTKGFPKLPQPYMDEPSGYTPAIGPPNHSI
ncbi:hypothetical protein [Vulcanisaeta sp. JCM 14467]|uniref:hypothetical protein n=1 Tax=Vulcanisaeta sp. JCM 14467 TaxID=1295370 RepID=UPI0006D05B87|nr:hypothetical protein [Vulcanisaeta sp. JCM 14467]